MVGLSSLHAQSKTTTLKTSIITIAALLLLSLQPAAQARGRIAKNFLKWAFGVGAAGTAAYVILKPKDVEAALSKEIQARLDKDKEKLFHSVHPVGTGKSVKVHEVKTYWKTEEPKSIEDLEGYVVRYTIYWEGPIRKDGYTKLVSVFDAEVDRFTASEVQATNGITKDDAMTGLVAFMDGFVGGLSSEQ